MKKAVILQTLAVIFAIFFITGCSDDGDGGGESSSYSSEKAITVFSFLSNVNSSLSTNVNGTISGNNIILNSYSGAAISSLIASYTVSEGATVRVNGTVQTSGTSANDFTNPVTYTVTAEDGSTEDYIVTVTYWRHPKNSSDIINPVGENATDPRIAMDNNGNIVALWEQSDGTNVRLFMSEHRNNSWSHPSDISDYISPPGGGDVEFSMVVMDNNRNVIIAWQQEDASAVSRVYMSEYRNGSWTHPSGILDYISPSDGGKSIGLSISMDDNGNAIIVWQQEDADGVDNIYLSEYREGSWIHPSGIDDYINPDNEATLYGCVSAQVAMDNNGNAIIVWIRNDSIDNWIFMSEYRNGSWTHPDDLNDFINPSGSDTFDPDVAMDDNGNAIIVWAQSCSLYDNHVYKSEFRNGAWVHPGDIDDYIGPGGDIPYNIQVVMDNSGNAVVVWSQDDDDDFSQIYMSEYRNNAWTHPADLSDYINYNDNSNNAYSPYVAMDNIGNTIVAWQQYNSGFTTANIFVSEFRNGLWNHPDDLNDYINPDGQSSGYPCVAMDDNGNAVIIAKTRIDTTSHIIMSEYR